MAPIYRESRERSVRSQSVLSDRSYSYLEKTATERKLNEYARFYGIDLNRGNREQSVYSEASGKRLARISEYDDSRATTERDVDLYRAGSVASERDYTKALVAANRVDDRYRTPAPEIYTSENYANVRSDTSAISDVMSYTRNILSLFPNDGNVKVHMNYRATQPIYNYSPTHKHFHVFSPNNYYVTPPAPAVKYDPPAPVYHHHYHYPTKSVTETTTRRYYLPASQVPSHREQHVTTSSSSSAEESSAYRATRASSLEKSSALSSSAARDYRGSSVLSAAHDYRAQSVI